VLLLDGSAVPTRTIAPLLSMDVATYELSFDGPDGDTNVDFTQIVSQASPVYSKSGMAVGSWTVAVTAKNGSGTPIAALNGDPASTQGFVVTAAEVTVVNVAAIPIIGTGGLTLTVAWPTTAILNPTVDAELTPSGSATGADLSFAPGTSGSNSTATYTRAIAGGWANGYYALTLQLMSDDDGAGGHQPETAWGWVEAVRIVAGQMSSASWELLALTGGISGTATNNMSNPIVVTFAPESIPSFAASAGLTVTANPAGYSYKWYLDGVALAEGVDGVTGTGAQAVTFAGGSAKLTVGNHNLSVIVTSGSTLSSSTIPFTVNP
jgi:hypothetical protein